MTVEIIIQPLSAQLDYRTLDNLRNDISREFENIKVTVATSNNSNLVELKKDTIFQSSFNQHRNQWYSPKLLDWFFEKFRQNKDTKNALHLGCGRVFKWAEFCVRGSVSRRRIRGNIPA
jgi:hypothetical protein